MSIVCDQKIISTAAMAKGKKMPLHDDGYRIDKHQEALLLMVLIASGKLTEEESEMLARSWNEEKRRTKKRGR